MEYFAFFHRFWIGDASRFRLCGTYLTRFNRIIRSAIPNTSEADSPDADSIEPNEFLQWNFFDRYLFKFAIRVCVCTGNNSNARNEICENNSHFVRSFVNCVN